MKYGVEFDLASVEGKVKHLRRRTPLSYADLEHFKSPDQWYFDRFWTFPPEEKIGPALEKEIFDFWNLPDSNEEDTVRRLLYIFKSIELASIVLRFIRPEHYSIYSSPIQHMLDTPRGRDLIDTYLIYIDNLRTIREIYGLERIADVDMALWVLHEKCFGQHRDSEIEKAYLEDDFMLQLRASNLVAPLADLSEARLAGALVDVKPDIAALIACHYLEILIRKLAKHIKLSGINSDTSLDEVINALPNYGPINAKRKALWSRLRQIRNDCFHKDRLPGPQERKLLIEETNRLESEMITGIAS
ncbi:MAG: hypothetical protein JW902_01990 [Syntrophaceae bacterium]|nr:hypothetical protein [Syntrophaceae bacterium]